MVERRGWPSARASLMGGVLAAVLAPAAATGLALVLQPDRELGATSIYLLAVVAAAALGGLGAGLASSAIGFLSLNYFFTEPLHTFVVSSREDVVALVVFLVVALVVGSLVARTVDERAKATRREREASLQSYFASKLLSTEPLDRVLGDFAAALLEPLRLTRCEIHARAGERSTDVARERSGARTGLPISIPLEAGGEELGGITVTRSEGLGPLMGEERRLLEAAARQLSGALERARLDAQVARSRLEIETNQARAALFSSVTHDLRTPLASIKAGVTSLLTEEVRLDAQEERELLRTVLEETDRLNRLVGNLLELAKARAGAAAPAKQPIAIDEVIESVLHRITPQLGRVRVRTLLREVPDVPADPVQIDQVVTNVLENAARFSPPGGEITVSVAPWKGAVQVRVSDHGPGIREEERGRVFEAFYRGRGETGGGSGLGLAIARAIVLAHGGRIWIEGAPSGGTAVVVQLPVKEPQTGRQERDS